MHSAPSVQINLGPIDLHAWEAVPQNQPMPLQQYWAYGETLKTIGADVAQQTFLVDNQPIGLALVGRRRFFKLLKFTSLMRGPVWFEGTQSFIPAALEELRKHHRRWLWDFLVLQPELSTSTTDQSLLRQAGCRRIMTGYSTIWLDLQPDPEALRNQLDGKWRNQLKKAEGNRLEITFGGRKHRQYSWLTDQETRQQSYRGYHGIPAGLVPIYAEIAAQFKPDDKHSGVLSVTALSGRRKVAGAIFLLHGNSATYHIGWSGEDGRKLNAQNRVLWEGLLALKERGIRFLDLGGINTAEGAGIARFKLGLGSDPTTLVGTWL